MSETIVGVRVEMAPADLEEATRRAPELRAVLGGATDAMAAQVDDKRAHLWVLGESGSPDELHALAESMLSNARVTSFTATRFADDRADGAGDARTSYAVPIPSVVPKEEQEELDTWYVEEHAPWLLRVPGWQRIRRYAVTGTRGEPWTRLVLHDLEDADVIKHPEVLASQQTPRRKSFATRPWFMAGGRAVLKRL